MPAPVTAVIFDWGGTLTPWHPVDLGRQWQVFAEAIHLDTGASEAASLAAALTDVEDRNWKSGRESHGSGRLHEIFADAGVDLEHPAFPAALAAYQRFWEPHTHTDAQVAPLWRWLKESGIAVGVLSNTIWTREYHRAIFDRDGVLDLIDGDVYSSEIDWVKPHPRAFLAAAEAVGAAPQECVYVGDRIFEDVHGPQQVGMRAIWIPHSDIPTAQQVAVEATPDAVAQQLTEIVGIVTGWLRS